MEHEMNFWHNEYCGQMNAAIGAGFYTIDPSIGPPPRNWRVSYYHQVIGYYKSLREAKIAAHEHSTIKC